MKKTILPQLHEHPTHCFKQKLGAAAAPGGAPPDPQRPAPHLPPAPDRAFPSSGQAGDGAHVPPAPVTAPPGCEAPPGPARPAVQRARGRHHAASTQPLAHSSYTQRQAPQSPEVPLAASRPPPPAHRGGGHVQGLLPPVHGGAAPPPAAPHGTAAKRGALTTARPGRAAPPRRHVGEVGVWG